MIEIKILSIPDHHGQSRIIREEIARALIDGGVFVLQDISRHIDARETIEGGAQKENSPGYAASKRRQRGHDIPVKRDGHLHGRPTHDDHGTASNYTLNGVSVRQPFQNLNSRALGIDAASRVSMARYAKITIRPPADRVRVLRYLVRMGYRPPLGLSARARQFIPRRMQEAFAIAKRRMRTLASTTMPGRRGTGGR